MKQKVFLITGFQNWGKSFIIKELFNNRTKFYKGKLYKLCDKNFCVQLQSNDDLGKEGYIATLDKRVKQLASVPEYIISAFCPTKEDINNSKRIISTRFKDCDVYLITLEYKWCKQAKLNVNELKNYYSSLKNLKIINIDEKDREKKAQAIEQKIYSLV